ncbi:vesicular, overexpressed in cancer, prosurvival protein 1-like [Salmo trutta]|uniref:vesicular, overexpressed in cancer, prosurvival protein 1-like n=1 Tax=Salmo trutta TaxID=8032 RepID=UPI0011328304|nr:vesicular, overexpressed in cancer, prosurvival protein 1-like [Salmo trutta]
MRTVVGRGAVSEPSPSRNYGTSGLQQPSMQNYGGPGGLILTPTFPYSPHPYPSYLAAPYPHPTPPAYCNLPPTPYEQVLQASEKR